MLLSTIIKVESDRKVSAAHPELGGSGRSESAGQEDAYRVEHCHRKWPAVFCSIHRQPALISGWWIVFELARAADSPGSTAAAAALNATAAQSQQVISGSAYNLGKSPSPSRLLPFVFGATSDEAENSVWKQNERGTSYPLCEPPARE